MIKQVTGAHLVRLLLVVSAMVFVLLPVAAFAQTDGGTAYPTTPTTPTTEVQGTVVTKSVSSSTGSLPFTGGDVALLSVLGVAALASGAVIVVFSKKRSTATAS